MKKIAPIIIVTVICAFLLMYLVGLGILSIISKSIIVTIILGIFCIVIVVVTIALIYTLVQRLKEIEKEKNDDLSKY